MVGDAAVPADLDNTVRKDRNISASSNNSTNSGFPTPGYFETFRSSGKHVSLDQIRELRFADGGKQIDFIALSMSQSSGRCESIARHDVSFRSFSSGRSQTTPSARSPAQKTHAYHPLETGNQMTSGTMRYDSPRHFGKTGRPSPDCTGWFMSTQNLRWILASTKSWNRFSNIRRNTSDLETKRKLGRATWRARRKAKRQRIQREMEDACRNKRCPHTHVEVCISIGRRRLGRTGNAFFKN